MKHGCVSTSFLVYSLTVQFFNKLEFTCEQPAVRFYFKMKREGLLEAMCKNCVMLTV